MGFKENSALKLSVLLNLKVDGSTVYGEINDYCFSLNLIPYGNTQVWQLTLLLDKTLSTDAQLNLKKTHKINIYQTQNLKCSKSSLYNYIDQNYLSARNTFSYFSGIPHQLVTKIYYLLISRYYIKKHI